jgi:hypothetical protein
MTTRRRTATDDAEHPPSTEGDVEMAGDHTHDHPDYGLLRAGGKYAVEGFEEADEQDEAALDPRIDVESNELHVAAGHACVRCGQQISADSDVRRLLSGEYQHELCPPVAVAP